MQMTWKQLSCKLMSTEKSCRFKPSASQAAAAVCTHVSCAWESLRIQQAVPWKTGMRKLSSIHTGNIYYGLGKAKLLLETEMCTSIFLKRFLFPPGPVDAGVIGQLLKGFAASAECSWFKELTVSKDRMWCHGKICVHFPTPVVNENVQLRTGRASFSLLTKARPFSCIWKNVKWYECCDRPSVCPELTVTDFNQFVSLSENACKICSIHANWVVSPSSRSSNSCVISSTCCNCSLMSLPTAAANQGP